MKKTLLMLLLLPAMLWATNPATTLETYYASAENKTGNTLVTTLQGVIDGHTVISYSGLEPYYQTTDWINGQIYDMYSTCTFTMADANKSQKRVCDTWNKEHSIPQSWFNEASPMKSDLFHVYPTDARVNNFRSNYPYGETSSTAYIDGDSHSLGHLGTSNFTGYTGTVYEPDDEYKGDFARTYMYMVVRYADKNFTQSANGAVMFNYNSSATPHASLTNYSVNLLMKWHREDPVSQKEIDRNNAVYGIQHNRNPFIDYPYLAEYIWGVKKGQQFHLTDVISAYDEQFILGESDGSRQITDPTISVPADALTLGPVLAGESTVRTISIKTMNLTGAVNLAISGNHFTVSPTSIPAASANGTHTITLTYLPTAAGTESASLTISSTGAESKTIALTGKCSIARSIVWMVDGQPYTQGDPSTRVVDGTMPEVLPTAPVSCDPTRVFVGWSATALNTPTDVVPNDLFAYEAEAPSITANTTFYAVFAMQSGTASQSDSVVIDGSTTLSNVAIGTVATAVFSKAGGSNEPKYYESGDAARLYAKGTLTISSENSITEICFGTCNGNTMSVNTGTWNQNTGTWTGSAESVVFTVGSTNGHTKLNNIRVTTGGGVAYSSYLTTLGCSVTGVESVESEHAASAQKVIIDGKLYIIREGVTYDIYGRR